MPSTFKWFGNRVKAYFDKQVDARMNGAGMRMTERAKELCPVDTGQLKDSIGFTYSQEQKRIILHADAPYAIYVEYGTYRMRARPFLRPAMLEFGSYFATAGSRVDTAFHTAKPRVNRNPSPVTAHTRHNVGIEKHYKGKLRRSRIHIRGRDHTHRASLADLTERLAGQ